jgi:lysyl-tRNA synthetase class 2
LLARLRKFFEDRDFLEVETPLLSHDTVVDRHIDPLAVTLFADPRQPQLGTRMWLQTSPEFAMKRLLAAGAERIYQIARAFRGGESGALHNPEFTLVEWYRVGDSMAEGMQLLSDLIGELLGTPEAERLSYRDAFLKHARIDPHQASLPELSRLAEARNISVPCRMSDRDDWLNLLLAEIIEPQLGLDRPVILFDYPVSQAALACLRDGDPPVAERYELYHRGVELANGYHELRDVAEFRERNRRANAERVADGRSALPEDSRLLPAMRHGLPDSCGAALGFDRCVMLAAHAPSVRDVIAFPTDLA